MVIDKLVVIGVGLIGGSFARALREAGQVRHVVGVGRTRRNLEHAKALGVIDEVATDIASAVAGADLIFLAAPVAQTGPMLELIAPYLGSGAIVTDAGSTKASVVASARAALGDHLPRFVPGHPIAGSEASGAGAATAELYRQKNVVLTPLPETDAEARQRVSALWQACGATVREMSPEQHDLIFAAVSHLPHVLAFALVDALAQRPEADDFFRYAASGFRDFTRIAGSSPEMWRDICLANREALLDELNHYSDHLRSVRDALEAKDGSRLLESFERASEARNNWARRTGKA